MNDDTSDTIARVSEKKECGEVPRSPTFDFTL